MMMPGCFGVLHWWGERVRPAFRCADDRDIRGHRGQPVRIDRADRVEPRDEGVRNEKQSPDNGGVTHQRS